MTYTTAMRSLSMSFLTLCVFSCASTQESSSLGQIIELQEDDVCSGVLSRAIVEAREASSDEQVLAISQAMRWALDHPDLRCLPEVTSQLLWQTSLETLTRLRTPSAALAIVVSLEQTHLPGSLNDRHNSTFREQTEASLRALEALGPHGPEVIDALIRWYGAGSADCSVEMYRPRIVAMMLSSDVASAMTLAEHFPPLSGGDRCVPSWLVVDFYRELPEERRSALVERIVDQPSSALARAVEVTGSMGAPLAPMTRAIAQRGCELVVERGDAAGDDIEASVDALDHAISLCLAAENLSAIDALQHRVLAMLVDNNRATEAWRLIEALPVNEMEPEERATFAAAVVRERLERDELSEAIAMMETISDGIGLEHESLRPARDALQEAILSTAGESIEAGDHDVAGRLLETADRLTGSNPATRPLQIRVELARFAVPEGEECPTRQVLTEHSQRLRRLQTEIARSFRNDDELSEAFQSAQRNQRSVQQRCSR